MQQVNIHVAKDQLTALVERAAAGEQFIIAEAGRPLALVSPYKKTEPLPRIGFMKNQIAIPDDFDRMGAEEILVAFEGNCEDNEGLI